MATSPFSAAAIPGEGPALTTSGIRRVMRVVMLSGVELPPPAARRRIGV